MRDRLAGESRGQRVGQIVNGRRGPLEAQVDVAIVDAAEVHDAAADDDGRFGRDGGLDVLYERELRIAKRLDGARVTEARHMLPDRRRLLGGVRIDETELEAFRSKRVDNAADFGCVAIRNRAVG